MLLPRFMEIELQRNRPFMNGLNDFQVDRKMSDSIRGVRPSISITEENVGAASNLVEEDRRFTVEIIARTLNLSVGSVHSILKDSL